MIEINKTAANSELVELQQQAVEKCLTADEAYESLRNPLKGQVVNQLLRDQGHLCAYCMRKLPDERKGLPHVKIEHWNARNGEHGETCGPYGALDYDNMLAVCSGNQNDSSKGKDEKLTCDASRSNKKLTANPLNPNTLTTIYYTEDGYIASSNSIIDHDLKVTLNLNCMRDSVQLPVERKKVLEVIQLAVSEELDMGTDPIEICKRLYHELLEISDDKPPYIGISLWWLKDFIDQAIAT